jgi:hypothetical protein
MTALAPPIWELAGMSPRAIALQDHRRRISFGELEERTNAFGHGSARWVDERPSSDSSV